MSAESTAATPVAQKIASWERKRRRVVFALAVLGAIAFAASWFQPWWNFRLVAPQYPKGLMLVIHLTGVTGDTAEINTINHYIGMHSLDTAAQLERASSGWIVGALAVAVCAGTLLSGRRFNWGGILVGAVLPAGFVGDTLYWLYRAGHDLDPTAAIHIKPFWPALFGAGKVGQFSTVAWPAVGFWLAVAGMLFMVAAVWQRSRVCRVCPVHDTCGVTCPHALLGAPT